MNYENPIMTVITGRIDKQPSPHPRAGRRTLRGERGESAFQGGLSFPPSFCSAFVTALHYSGIAVDSWIVVADRGGVERIFIVLSADDS